MALSNDRVVAQGVTRHPHEQEAILFLRQALPDQSPLYAWFLVNLQAGDGRVHEIDAIVIGRRAVFLVEVKSHPGTFRSRDLNDWERVTPEGRPFLFENPLHTTAAKCRVLASALKKTLGPACPWVEPLVFLAHPEVKIELPPLAREKVVDRATIVRAIVEGDYPGAPPHLAGRVIRQTDALAVKKALVALGLTQSKGQLALGSLLIREVLEEGPEWQDRYAEDQHLAERRRRVRFYHLPLASSPDVKASRRKAAEREAKLLTILGDHPNILTLHDSVPDGPTGTPCLVFEHVDGATHLDDYLRDRPDLPFERRLDLVRTLASTLAWVHQRRITHNGLHPGAVLVADASPHPPTASRDTAARPDAGPQLRLYNFQLGERSDVTPTLHASRHLGATALVYRAPELLHDPTKASYAADAFSLGALTWLVLTGQPLCETISERAALLADGPPALAARLQALGMSAEQAHGLAEALGFTFEASPLNRPDDVREWLDQLERVFAAPDAAADRDRDEPDLAATAPDPLTASPGDRLRLPDGTTLDVLGELGLGVTSRVLHVRRASDKKELALKVSRSTDPSLFEAEARTLAAVKGDRVIPLEQLALVGDRPCLLLGLAKSTLARRMLGQELLLDEIEDLGRDLLLALEHLEDQDVLHKDLKPANLGLVELGGKKTKLRLQLLDFSLSEVAALDIGTPAYRDPLVFERAGWDHDADRWSAAVVLYELLTGQRPRWLADESPTNPKAELDLAADRFPALIREPLAAFFRKAFRPKAKERHRSAREMSRAWEAISAPRLELHPAVGDGVTALTRETPVQALPLTPTARSVLDRKGIATLAELLALPENRLSAIRGARPKTLGEILDFRRALVAARPDLAVAPAAPAVGVLLASPLPGWLQDLLPTRASKRPSSERTVRVAFGIDAVDGRHAEDAKAAAALLGVSPQNVYLALGKLRAHWPTVPAMVDLRAAVDLALAARGGVARLDAVAEALAPGGDPELLRVARGLVRVAAEASPEGVPPLALQRLGRGAPWVASDDRLLSAVRALGQAADRLVAQHELAAPSLAKDALADALGPDAASYSADRLIALGGQASETAAASTALELYARTLSPGRALAAVVGTRKRWGPDELGALVAARFGEAPPMPARPALDAAMDGLGYGWDEAAGEYRARMGSGLATDSLTVLRTVSAPGVAAPVAFGTPAASLAVTARVAPGAAGEPAPVAPTEALAVPPQAPRPRPREATDAAAVAVAEVVRALRLAVERKDLRVIETSADKVDRVEAWLGEVVGVAPRAVDHLLVQAMKRQVARLGIERAAVDEADRQGPSGPDWPLLTDLMQRAGRDLLGELLAVREPLVLTRPGLLARYHLRDVLGGLVDAVASDRLGPVFLVVPRADDEGPAAIDAGRGPIGALPIPTVTRAQRLRLPREVEDRVKAEGRRPAGEPARLGRG